ncbi:hypothetical protein CRI94_12990 [Longibacter salinarum]|uniref:DUF2007 domain-containing protein n=1 Tax=Longibacter salinarum TaxID=1850348 RepID=A0A2A8CWB8_9BACT|nr:hypothetical protein [Longibacter salinarum]PEN12913.1 hypothetical protein CRI94_12990 [Longibacter salinarum]
MADATASRSNPLARQPVTVIAHFANRRYAEMAKTRLQEAAIDALVIADDAGGIRPDLEHVHGVKLGVLRHEASDAIAALVDAGWTDEVLLDLRETTTSDGDFSSLFLWIGAGLAFAAALAIAVAYAVGAL